jgi:hypothetical protein
MTASASITLVEGILIDTVKYNFQVAASMMENETNCKNLCIKASKPYEWNRSDDESLAIEVSIFGPIPTSEASDTIFLSLPILCQYFVFPQIGRFQETDTNNVRPLM